MSVEKLDPAPHWRVLATCQEAINWLEIQANLGVVNEPAGRLRFVPGWMRVHASGDQTHGHQATSGSW